MYRAPLGTWRSDSIWTTAGTLRKEGTLREGFAASDSGKSGDHVLPRGSFGCATPGFACAEGLTCVNDNCVAPRGGGELDVVREAKTYYSHDGLRWLAGRGESCDRAGMACHRGMECVGAKCAAYVPIGDAGKGYDCRAPHYMCVPGTACGTRDGVCNPVSGSDGKPADVPIVRLYDT